MAIAARILTNCHIILFSAEHYGNINYNNARGPALAQKVHLFFFKYPRVLQSQARLRHQDHQQQRHLLKQQEKSEDSGLREALPQLSGWDSKEMAKDLHFHSFFSIFNNRREKTSMEKHRVELTYSPAVCRRPYPV
ncbi:hypothetical protein PoB_005280700 [Plakobranchus ocellatus]|uniref:Uncharacterized protein n=1 Tax=Plakobranchus ocellatus TaxID=259542 RepID=A0AAV4C4K3_9GAST|nr:hypothetical protein PoB_005280700 [Plakobranchus ocellatus]